MSMYKWRQLILTCWLGIWCHQLSGATFQDLTVNLKKLKSTTESKVNKTNNKLDKINKEIDSVKIRQAEAAAMLGELRLKVEPDTSNSALEKIFKGIQAASFLNENLLSMKAKLQSSQEAWLETYEKVLNDKLLVSKLEGLVADLKDAGIEILYGHFYAQNPPTDLTDPKLLSLLEKLTLVENPMAATQVLKKRRSLVLDELLTVNQEQADVFQFAIENKVRDFALSDLTMIQDTVQVEGFKTLIEQQVDLDEIREILPKVGDNLDLQLVMYIPKNGLIIPEKFLRFFKGRKTSVKEHILSALKKTLSYKMNPHDYWEDLQSISAKAQERVFVKAMRFEKNFSKEKPKSVSQKILASLKKVKNKFQQQFLEDILVLAGRSASIDRLLNLLNETSFSWDYVFKITKPHHREALIRVLDREVARSDSPLKTDIKYASLVQMNPIQSQFIAQAEDAGKKVDVDVILSLTDKEGLEAYFYAIKNKIAVDPSVLKGVASKASFLAFKQMAEGSPEALMDPSITGVLHSPLIKFELYIDQIREVVKVEHKNKFLDLLGRIKTKTQLLAFSSMRKAGLKEPENRIVNIRTLFQLEAFQSMLKHNPGAISEFFDAVGSIKSKFDSWLVQKQSEAKLPLTSSAFDKEGFSLQERLEILGLKDKLAEWTLVELRERHKPKAHTGIEFEDDSDSDADSDDSDLFDLEEDEADKPIENPLKVLKKRVANKKLFAKIKDAKDRNSLIKWIVQDKLYGCSDCPSLAKRSGKILYCPASEHSRCMDCKQVGHTGDCDNFFHLDSQVDHSEFSALANFSSGYSNICFFNSAMKSLVFLISQDEKLYSFLMDPKGDVLPQDPSELDRERVRLRMHIRKLYRFVTAGIDPLGDDLITFSGRIIDSLNKMNDVDNIFVAETWGKQQSDPMQLVGIMLEHLKLPQDLIISSRVVAESVGYSSLRPESYRFLSLPVVQGKSIQELMDEFSSPEILSAATDNALEYDEDKPKVEGERSFVVTKAPHTLWLSLKRYSWDYDSGPEKNKGSVAISRDLYVVQHDSETGTKPIRRLHYELITGIKHTGGKSLSAGHYTSYTFSYTDDNKIQIVDHNDEKVSTKIESKFPWDLKKNGYIYGYRLIGEEDIIEDDESDSESVVEPAAEEPTIEEPVEAAAIEAKPNKGSPKETERNTGKLKKAETAQETDDDEGFSDSESGEQSDLNSITSEDFFSADETDDGYDSDRSNEALDPYVNLG